MPIEIQCPQCRRKFRVPDRYAGKRVKCPKCEGTIGIPAAGTPAAEGTLPKAKADPWQGGADEPSPPRWYLQTEDGQKYGPASREDLDGWMAEGRIDASCQVLCDGWEAWRWADEVFPELAEGPSETQPAAEAAPEDPFAGIAEAAPHGPPEANPYVSPRELRGDGMTDDSGEPSGGITPRMREALRQTRPWVLLLSILGFIGAGLGAIASLLYTAISVGAVGAMGAVGAVFVIGALMMAATTVLYFFAAYHLFTYASAIAHFLRSRQARDLERALLAQKSFWKLAGIVTAALIAVYLLLVMVFMVLGGAASTMG